MKYEFRITSDDNGGKETLILFPTNSIERELLTRIFAGEIVPIINPQTQEVLLGKKADKVEKTDKNEDS